MSKAAIAHLCATQPEFAPLVARIGPAKIPIEDRTPYEALVRSIAHQQLHGNAARAILGRLHALHGDQCPPAAALAATTNAQLRACGFSGSKIAALRDVCAKTLDGTVPSPAAARRLTDEALIERLCTIRGIGRWTVEMLLIFTLKRRDVLPVDDFGVRDGWRILTGAEAQLKPRALAAIGEAWSPYRSVAAWYLWRAADEHKRIKQSV